MKKWQGIFSSAAAFSMLGTFAVSGAPVASAHTHAKIPTGETITLWSWQGGPEFDAVKRLAQQWAKAHGDTVNVIDQSKNPNGFQFYATAARTGKGPDVLFGMPHDNNGTFQMEGLLAPVPSGLINPKEYTKSEIDAVTIQGRMYSLPVSAQTTALFYNKKLVKKAPVTWNQFVKAANKSGFAFDQSNLYFNYAFVGGLGGYVFKNVHGTLDPNNIGLANPGAIKAFTLLHDFDAKYHWMKPQTNGGIAKAQFVAGKLGMYISGPWDVPDLNNAKVPYSIATLPELSNGHKATPFMGVITTLVNSHSHSLEADWSLADAISGRPAQLAYFNASEQIPTVVSLQKSFQVQSSPYFKAFADQINVAVPMPNIPQMQAVWSAMSVITNIINGKVSPAAGAKDFVSNIKKGIAVQGN